MATRMQQRRGTAAQWTAANPILAAGEIGFETDTSKFKMGNGSSTWTALQYFANAAELAALVDGAPDLLNTLGELAAAFDNNPDFMTNLATTVVIHASDTTNIHGIADMTALALTADVATTVSTAVSTHNSDTTNVHGIADTSNLASASDLTNHTSDTTSVHGIVDTADLLTTAAMTTEISDRNSAIATHNSDTTNVHGISDTADLVTTAMLADAVTPSALGYAGLAGVGLDYDSVNDALDIDSTVATKTYADSAVSTHSSDTTDVHGIANTANLATKTYADNAVSTHDSDTTSVHGIADTSALALTATVNTALDLKANLAGPTFTGTVSGITKSMVGLGSVDNTSDSAKPVSTAAQTALDLKANLAGPTFTGTVSGITKSMVGLGSVDNTTDAGKPVSTATQTALDLKANLASPTLTGTPLAPTAATGTNTTQVATTGFVQQELSILTTGAPALLNTLDELAAALGDDANYASTVTTALSTKAPLANPTFTGTVSGITKSMVGLGSVDNTADASKPVSTAQQTALDLKSNLASPTFTGTVTAPAITATALITASASGVAFTDGTQTKEGTPSRTPIIQKTAAYTLSALTERDSLIEVSSATGVTVTIPTNTAVAYPVGTSIDILQTGAGQVTIAPVDGTVTVNATPGLKLRTTWSSCTLFKRATNTWVVYGDLTA